MGRITSALGHRRTFAAQNGMSALPSKADICSALIHVRYGRIADIPIQRCYYDAQILISAGKPHRGPLCIARKPHVWRFSGIREYCFGPLRRLGNTALHLCHSCAQHCWRVQRILGEVFLGSFAGTRAYCLLALACRRSVFEVLCRNQLPCLFSPEQHQTGRQKLRRQQREAT